MQLFLLKNY
ncbi:Protein of unknown function [Bacillus cereus]|nr:Protein of unknown function [Bacillus cereus]